MNVDEDECMFMSGWVCLSVFLMCTVAYSPKELANVSGSIYILLAPKSYTSDHQQNCFVQPADISCGESNETQILPYQ